MKFETVCGASWGKSSIITVCRAPPKAISTTASFRTEPLSHCAGLSRGASGARGVVTSGAEPAAPRGLSTASYRDFCASSASFSTPLLSGAAGSTGCGEGRNVSGAFKPCACNEAADARARTKQRSSAGIFTRRKVRRWRNQRSVEGIVGLMGDGAGAGAGAGAGSESGMEGTAGAGAE